MPKISVIFPVGNRQEYLTDAMDSVLNQSFTDFELVVVLDGVSNAVQSIVRQYRDARIRCIDLPVNMGVCNARNVAIAAAQGKYLALMDSDDVALPDRFKSQFNFLENNLNVTACGSNSVKILENEHRVPMRYPETDAMIKARLLIVDSAILNPTAMIRTQFIRQHSIYYDANFPRDHDHRFYVDMVRHRAVFYGIQEELLLYRRHASNITKNQQGVDEEKTRVREALWPMFFPELTGFEASLLLRGFCRNIQTDLLTAFDLVAAQNKALRESRVFFGEDRTEIRRIIGNARRRVLAAFEQRSSKNP